ncbi:MAG: hypothetical protein A2744_01405 [Candidatus Buchananbacteria bacterium RIFCSPHIGHO2_01_FULL_44_11]|uniref:Glycosyltransferase RgtA/B/C/D-like domain-containing protein n=1 Tax=Candidatus Buchananbacteria bacterium RIFCSPHIGHO2_01_FULL_44_11 TaxID=1797535 RepID=A0A1G1XZ36_9BACT|nr:MAG: hypothetical protein A2744_01405 [Candidatus Buchananbacteria bacterium RIFCSPHIGHO2_01_FULL_44_11]
MSLVKMDWEKLVLLMLAVSFFVGIGHAFPMFNVISDEMYFVGGVLRAMENHTILPAAGDVPYGTLTYFLNYILVAGFLIILLPFFGFSVFNLKMYLVQSPELIYFLPRLLSALLALVLLWLFNQMFKKELADYRSRLLLLILLFTNLLVVSVLHTGKVWVLSIVLSVTSFYFFYQALSQRRSPEFGKKLANPLFFSIFFAFLAALNFPIFIFGLINIPILILYFWPDKKMVLAIVEYTLFALGLYIVISLLNFGGIKTLFINTFTAYRPLDSTVLTDNLSVLSSIWLNTQKTLAFFAPLILFLVLVVKNGIKNKILFFAATAYFLTYFFTISVVATWATTFYAYSRYLMPLGFFLTLLIASFNFNFRKYFYLIGAVSLVYFSFLLYYLSVPTTFNQAYDFVQKNINQENVVIINQVWELQLPKNKPSYLLEKENFCATKCRNTITYDLNPYFQPLVIDRHTQEDVAISPDATVYYFENNQQVNLGLELVASFENNLTSKTKEFFSVDSRLANYFDFDFFRIKNFGSNIYVYRKN